MPLPRPDLLAPIAGENPSGENLRYAPIYDKIKDARTEEVDDGTLGDWQRTLKRADWNQVIKLCGEALATKSKDLMLTSWLGEAMIKKQGIVALPETLELQRQIVEQFWDSLYPEIEDGDVEMRAMPLEWLSTRSRDLLREIPLTKKGLHWLKYKESRAIPTEADSSGSEDRTQARQEAIDSGKTTPEDFDAQVDASPLEFYEELWATIEKTEEQLRALDNVCGEKFGNVSPDFSVMRGALEEIKQVAHVLRMKKRDAEGVSDGAPGDEEVAEEAQAEESGTFAAGSSGAAAAPARAKRAGLGAAPQSWDEAIAHVAVAAEYMRKEKPDNPAAYVMVRAMRFGEMLANGESPDPSLMESPGTEVRQQLKKLAYEGEWQQVLDIAENAAVRPSGRAWLDLHRYAHKALDNLGYGYAAKAVCAQVATLLAGLPGVENMTLNDDTPTANNDTQEWFKEYVRPTAPEPTPESAQGTEETWSAPMPEPVAAETAEAGEPDVFQLASEKADAGKVQEAIEMMSDAARSERAGRRRFLRQAQLSQICLANGYERLAYPILLELSREIDERRLDTWEDGDTLAQPLALLLRCMDKVDKNSESKQVIYARLCRLSPRLALSCKQ